MHTCTYLLLLEHLLHHGAPLNEGADDPRQDPDLHAVGGQGGKLWSGGRTALLVHVRVVRSALSKRGAVRCGAVPCGAVVGVAEGAGCWWERARTDTGEEEGG